MPTDLLMIGALGVFVAFALVVYVVVDYAVDRQQVRARLRQLPEIELAPTEVRERELAAPITQRIIGPGFERLAHRTRRYAPAGMIERLENLLEQAGSPPAWDGERLFAAKIVVAAVVAVLVAVFAPVAGYGIIQTVIGGAILIYAGWMAPEWVVGAPAPPRPRGGPPRPPRLPPPRPPPPTAVPPRCRWPRRAGRLRRGRPLRPSTPRS
jgi:hypothetical protein